MFLFLIKYLEKKSIKKDTNNDALIDYFNNYLLNLSNNTLNYYIKGVIKPKI